MGRRSPGPGGSGAGTAGVRTDGGRQAWSPQQISQRLRREFPDEDTMRISHEAIYQALYIQGRGALRRELVACLWTGRALRVPRARTRTRNSGFIGPEAMISARPAGVADRAESGHWKGDLINGLNQSAIGTLVERSTRSTMLLHLPRMNGYGSQPAVKNGPALSGHGAEAVRDAITSSIMSRSNNPGERLNRGICRGRRRTPDTPRKR
jgi:hypothetical protein